jgi:alkylation response protein AidB-like acyl-CoA dehydrogenase
MDLELTPEQDEIVSAASNLLEKEADPWPRCAELGWFALAVPEAFGGVGYGAAEASLLFVELGRHLVPGPFLGTVVASRLAATTGLDLAASLLSGERGVALVDGGNVYERRPGDLGVAITQGGATLFPAAALQDGEALVAMDPSTTIERLDVDDAEAVAQWGPEAQAWELALVLTAAMLSGIAEATLAQSVEHVSSREQFGQPIGAFQAVRHRCADMAIRAEAARAVTRFAALSVDASSDDARFQALSAVTVARNAALANAHDNVQNHGAMGFTAEHRAHLYVKRARLLASRMGGRRAQLDALLASPAPMF